MFRYQILIEYVGTNFRGWQIQKKGKTAQGLLQSKISKTIKRKYRNIWSWKVRRRGSCQRAVSTF